MFDSEEYELIIIPLLLILCSMITDQYSTIVGVCDAFPVQGHLGPVIAMDFDATSTLLATGQSSLYLYHSHNNKMSYVNNRLLYV